MLFPDETAVGARCRSPTPCPVSCKALPAVSSRPDGVWNRLVWGDSLGDVLADPARPLDVLGTDTPRLDVPVGLESMPTDAVVPDGLNRADPCEPLQGAVPEEPRGEVVVAVEQSVVVWPTRLFADWETEVAYWRAYGLDELATTSDCGFGHLSDARDGRLCDLAGRSSSAADVSGDSDQRGSVACTSDCSPCPGN